MPTEDHYAEAIQQAREFHQKLRAEIGKKIVGQSEIVDQMTICLLAKGHSLLVGVPGLAKTMLIQSLAEAIHVPFHRIQFTPDLMPADITGTNILEEDQVTGRRSFAFMQGPLFTNILLADEINRTPPKTQAALLQAMQERSVSVGQTTYKLAEPFFVLATQNPIEQEGTYPLPEAQLDRFLFMLLVDYPSHEEEVNILRATTGAPGQEIAPVATGEQVIAMQQALALIPCPDQVLEQVVRLTSASRPADATAPEEVKRYVRWGAGPRASQFLVKAAKVRAALAGRFNVEMEDIHALAKPVLRHRILLNYHAEADGVSADAIIDNLVTGKAARKTGLKLSA